mmetsp:Transcript_25571/g.35295  ORF Transcript_25571/g.35295 Transcript_25571/m.35295 type:complete len:291 (+) Transcript_25571:73-945(+)|eukprot:CAMPEP_0196578798 /NCGR_PEP_ID=MMETSP1081-20130531/7627_1 /TAXON_ID=36882 /ORGANISM="Pyramimonas amylifera, Strain CCMP720" /LENGTH=290 /DNA_ID=CAMNT_0041898127 /DNA_START=62 /DNA_END=934 /DNA_ORIENTATION=-
MADEEILPAFDPTMKKKKKKVDLDLSADNTAAAVDQAADDISDLSLDFGKKKKKKVKDLSGDLDLTAGDDGAAVGDLGVLGLKKKKKKKKIDLDGLEDLGDLEGGDDVEAEGDGDAENENNKKSGSGLPWDGSDRDYHYEELLGRVYGILRSNNPELAGEKQKTILKPPQVLREGTKKTVFVNFMELCKTMHRQPDHVMGYMNAELGTSGSLDGQQRLIMKGRFTPKVFEGILRRYVNEYVICNMCKSTDTLLSREQRLFILRCQPCGASRSVGAIKTGFVAQVGRRKKA